MSRSADGASRPAFAILASGRGSNAEALMDAFESTLHDADLVLVVSDNPGAAVVAKAQSRGYPTAVVPLGSRSRREHEAAVLEALTAAAAAHLLLAGYMRVLSPWFLGEWEGTILNIHPSLLPEFPGLHAPARQWEAGVAAAGATVHFVTEEVDAGPVLLQRAIAVRGDEGPEGLAHRILTEVEHRIYPEAVRMVVDRLSATRRAPGEVRRALLSVSDKEGVVELARRLAKLDVALVASGGTAAALAEAGVPVTPVEAVTGAREVLGGRVKTLHPAVHAGILADRRDPAHMREMVVAGYEPIDLVVCNLYPFAGTVAAGAPEAEVIENIDIGGPTLIRAAAKNADGGVTVLTDPADYQALVAALEDGPVVPLEHRRRLAARAFGLVTAYDTAISAWMDGADEYPWSDGFTGSQPLRYGENPHQEARLLVSARAGGVASGRLLHGKELSYNNLLDLDAAYRAAFGGEGHRCAVVKHTNPCGLAEAVDQAAAFGAALSGDPMSAFGSVIGFNRPVEEATAAAIAGSGLFVECIAAPGFDPGARAVLERKRNLRLFEVPPGDPTPPWHFVPVGGGVLVQRPDPGPGDPAEWQVVTERTPSADDLAEMAFAMSAVSFLKSNAICVTSDRTMRGAGAGLMSRVDACRLALEKAGGHAAGAVLASDGFFPFDDCVRLAAAAGVVAVVQPGGSRRDDGVIAACDEAGVAMVLTGRRHFRH